MKLGATLRIAGYGLFVSAAILVAFGFVAFRKDISSFEEVRREKLLWPATQIEVEMLRFQLALAGVLSERSEESLEAARQRFDILWSRVFLMNQGRVGRMMRAYDEGYGTLDRISAHLERIDTRMEDLAPTDHDDIRTMLASLDGLQRTVQFYTIRVMRHNSEAMEIVQDRINVSARMISLLSIAVVLLSLVAIARMVQENRAQRRLAASRLHEATSAEMSSRAKSNFLTMMSHELRNPLNGILGPLLLLAQSQLGSGQKRLVTQARSSGETLVQMLNGLLDYGEMQDGRLELKPAPFQLTQLASSVGTALDPAQIGRVQVRIRPGMPERVKGDLGRIRQIVLHLAEFVMEAARAEHLGITIGHDGERLTVKMAVSPAGPHLKARFETLTGVRDIAPDETPDNMSGNALRPLIARGLIEACGGTLEVEETGSGRGALRVAIPAPVEAPMRVRVRLASPSAALATIYHAALQGDRVEFLDEGAADPADIVLVDVNCLGRDPLITELRRENPGALFMALGVPDQPLGFDDIIENPNDVGRLRNRILEKSAS